MMIRKLDHYNIRTMKYDETVRFYVDVLGMRNDRPPMAREGSPPTWLHDDSGAAAIHLTPVDIADPVTSYEKMMAFRTAPTVMDPPEFRGSGAVDHVAFQCDDIDEMRNRLRTRDIPYVEYDLSRFGLYQLFIKDPNGITLELNFSVAAPKS